MQRFSLFLAFLLSAVLLSAQTIITGDITTNTTWDLAGSPYEVMNNIKVDNGIILTIDPGVTVLMNDDVNLRVNGELSAVGTVSDSIVIGSLTGSFIGDIRPFIDHPWQGILLGTSGILHLEYVQGSLAKNFLQFYLAGNPAATIRHTSFVENSIAIDSLTAFGAPTPLLIENCEFKFINQAFTLASNLKVKDSKFDYVNTGILGFDVDLESCDFIDLIHTNYLSGGKVEGCYFAFENYSPPGLFIGASIQANVNLPFSSAPIIINNVFHAPNAIRVTGYDPALTITNNEICTSGEGILFAESNSYPGTVDVSNNCWCTLDTASIAAQVIDSTNMGSTSPAPNVIFLPIDSSCVPTSVYPGDANHDQIANNTDLLPIGLHYGTTGPIRAGASLAWTAQPAGGWGDTLISTGADIKHVDTDGNGIINDDDTLAINLNYLQTHNGYKTSKTSVDGIPLYLNMPTTPPSPGDTVAIPVMFGTVDTPAVDIYGLSFSIEYDSSIVEEGMTEASFDGSWLGTKGIDMLTIFRDIDTLQQLDFGLVRTDQMNRTGMGQIAEIFVVIDDDIFKKEVPFVLNIVNAYAIDVQEQAIDLDVKPGIASIEEPTDAMSPYLSQALKLYPNPAQDEVLVELAQERIQQISVLNPNGQVVDKQRNINSNSSKIDLRSYPKGIYLIHVQTASGFAIKKLMIQ